MYKKIILLVIMSVVAGCGEGGSKGMQDDQECPMKPACEGNSRVYCEAGKRVTEACQTGQTCVDGVCALNGACDGTFEAQCTEGVAVSCVEGEYEFELCRLGCRNGVCIEKLCPSEKPFPYCDETGQRVICGATGIEKNGCGQGTVCHDGTCIQPSATCGDGHIDLGEACDDGEQNGQYGKCNLDCLAVIGCGDGIIQEPEEKCDQGEDNGKYTKCRTDCQSVSQCGDGHVDEPNEVCDDGVENGNPGKCSTDCQMRQGCGNGIIDGTDETCDPPSAGLFVTCKADCKKQKILFEEYPVPDHVSTELNEQCDPQNLWQKYLVYRERFIGNAAKHIPGFISWGTEPGESLPAGYRDPSMNCATNWRYHHEGADCAFSDLPDAQGAYSWGDTSLWLGIMLHWLALEYRVYQAYGLDTTETKKYIALALKAFDRLDLSAEPFFEVEPKLDGFFIRDDIPRNFYIKEDGYRFARTDGFSGYECAASNTVCQLHSGVGAEALLKDGTFVSQDQLTGIYEGLGMIGKLVDEDAEYDGMKLRSSARSAIHRIITYLRDNHWLIGIETAKGWLQVPEEWGGYTQMLSALFAEAANSICAPDFGYKDYHDDATRVAKKLIPGLVTTLWPLWETSNNYNRNLILRLMNYTEFWDDTKLAQVSLESGREFWALSHALYWDRPLPDDYPLWRIPAILASAPCDGPCSGEACDVWTPGWMGENYFVSPNQRIGSPHIEGEYNGLDYLITHLLYVLAYAQKTGRGIMQDIGDMAVSGHVLEDIISMKAKPEQYLIYENKDDMSHIFCGRPFSDWLRDNALGLVDIYTGTARWACTMEGVCEIREDSKPYTHRNSVIIGTNDKDTITIPRGFHHCVSTLGGDDVVTAAAGMHIIDGGDGNDTLKTNGPHVTIYGGKGDDMIYPGAGYHLVDAGDGNDLVDSGNSSGTHLIYGGLGNDVLRAGEGGNYIVGGPGNDIIEAMDGDNSVWGNDGDDKFWLGGGNNIIRPGKGNAYILVGNGNNSITTFSPQTYQVNICFGSGKNSIYADWSWSSHCSAVQNSDIHDNSCRPDLTAEDCNLTAYKNWK